MKIKGMYKRVIAMTIAAFMLPWSSFVYGANVEAASYRYTTISHENDYKTDEKTHNDEKASPNDATSVRRRSMAAPQEESIEFSPLIVDSSITLTEDMEVSDVDISPKCSLDLNGHRLLVHGDFKMNGSSGIIFNNGSVYIDGNFDAYPSSGYVKITMKNSADYMYVEGNIDLKDSVSVISDGTIECRGDVKLTSLFSAYGKNIFIFSGYSPQNLTMPGGSFNKVILNNTSEEGLIIKDSFNYNSLEDNDCKITIENSEGILGYTLEKDEEYDEQFILGAGILDLSGHTLTVNGDFIHSGGTVILNGGKLIINGSYKMQKRTVEGEEVIYTKAKSILSMKKDDDLLQIQGDLIVENSVSTYSSVTNGTIVVSGNIDYITGKNTYGLSTSEDNKLILSSEYPQEINAKNGGLHNVYFENTSEEGISFIDTVGVSGVFSEGDTHFTGDINIIGDTSFAKGSYVGDLTISGKAALSGDLNLTGDLTVDSELTVNDSLSVSGNIYQNNKITTYGDLEVSGGIFSEGTLNNIHCNGTNTSVGGDVENIVFNMSSIDDYVSIGGNYSSLYSYRDTPMTNGTLEVKGDINCASFKADGEHRLLLSGETYQTVEGANKMTLGILELNNHSEEGVLFDHLVKKNKLVRNGCRLRYGDLEGEFGWRLEGDEVYEGDLVLLDDTLDLNGHTLTVNGSLIHMSGEILINGGRLVVSDDYRLQSIENSSDNQDGYEYLGSTGTLVMQNESDAVIVKGNLYIDGQVNNKGKITRGTIDLRGDLNQIRNSNSFFSFNEGVLLKLSGDKAQSITGESIFYTSNLDIENQVNISFDKRCNISDKFICNDKAEIEGDIRITGGINPEVSGSGINSSLYISSGIIDTDFHITGDLTSDISLTVKGVLTVDGDYYPGSVTSLYNKMLISGDIKKNKAKSNFYLYKNANFTVKGLIDPSLELLPLFCDYNAEMHVNDYYTRANGSYDCGTIYVSGNLTGESIRATNSNLFIFDGDSLQVIDVPAGFKFANVKLDNHSDDGIVSKTIFNKDSLDINGCKFRYEGIDGIVGYNLTKDETIEGDLVILEGAMNLNGHTLSVTGDLIQVSGDLNINGGKLIVGGDYRQQTRQLVDGVYRFTNSDSTLTMKDSRDVVEIEGDFVSHSNLGGNRRITCGRMTIGGGLDVSGYGFRPSDSFVLEFTSGKTHTISNGSALSIPILYISSGDKTILDGSSITISNTLDIKNTLSNITINLNSEDALVGNTFNGNLSIYSEITKDLTVNGSLSGSPKLTGNITVNGNASMTNLEMNGGSFVVSGNCDLDYLTMKSEKDLIRVEGDFDYKGVSSRVSDGCLEIGGDVTFSGSGFSGTNNNRVVLIGEERQVLSCSDGSFATLELRNYSSEGVFSETYLKYDDLIMNGCILTYGFGEALSGFTLSGDYNYSGDMFLVDGVMDLSGHTLTVDGDLIHAGGSIKVNNGRLIVKGDLREERPTGDTYQEGYGELELESDKDEVTIYGDAYLNTRKTDKMSTGIIRLRGDLIRSIGVNTLNCGTCFSLEGNEKQNISGIEKIARLEISNSEGFTYSGKSLTVTEHLKKTSESEDQAIIVTSLNVIDSEYKGSIVLGGNDTLEKDVNIRGTLYIDDRFRLGGHTVTADNLIVQSTGSLVMESGDDYILARNNFVIDGIGSSESESQLTDGCIEVNGNFICNRDSFFNAEGNHKVLVTPGRSAASESYMQVVVFGDDLHRTSKLNTLILRGRDGRFKITADESTVANKVVYEYSSEELAPVRNLAAKEVSEDRVTISFTDDNTSSSGYVIFCNGVRRGSSATKEYTDTGLRPGTSYKYTVYVADKYWNLLAASEELEVITADDTEAPSVPVSLEISSKTGKSISLRWIGSHDNIDTPVYNLYRNGELIVEGLEDTEYTDNDLDSDVVFTYEVSALDSAGNESQKSESVVAVTDNPEITRVEPEDLAKIGGKSVELKAYYKNYGPDSANTLSIEYSTGDGEWKKVTSSPLGQTRYNSTENISTYTWNIGNIRSDMVSVRYTLTDAAGVSSSYETEYEIDHTAPDPVEELRVEDNNGVALLSWKISGERDLASYNIYRCISDGSGEDIYSRIATNNDRYNTIFSDNTLEEGTTARYIVSAVDDLGNESSLINPVEITVKKDNEAPEVKAIEPYERRLCGSAEISAVAEDNKGVGVFFFYIRRDGEENWVEIGSSEAEEIGDGFRGSVHLDTTSLEDGIYYIEAVAVDTSGNLNQTDYFVRYEIDNTGTEKVVINKTVAGSTYVQLIWDDVKDLDFGYFLVEERRVDGSFEEVLREEFVTGCTIRDLIPEKEYIFRVCGVDTSGNKGQYSEEVTVSTRADETRPVISSIGPAEGRYKDSLNLSMTATDNYMLSRAVISISRDGEVYEELSEISLGGKTNQLGYTLDISDEDVFPEGELYIKYEVYDLAGNRNSLLADGSEVIMRYTVDRTRPEEVEGLSAVGYDGYIGITWEEGTEEDIARYQVYRSDADSGIYKRVMDGESLNYYDTNVESGKCYEYYVVAVDEAGNMSPASNIVFAAAYPDKTAPRIEGMSPTDGGMIGRKQSFSIIATDNSCLNSIKTYYRREDSDVWTLINESSAQDRAAWIDFSYDFSNEEEGRLFFKTICADVSGNTSSEYLSSYILDKTPPKASLTVSGGNFEINMMIAHRLGEADISYYEIYRADLSKSSTDKSFFDNAKSIRKIAAESDKAVDGLSDTIGVEFTDKDVDPRVAYRYAARIYDDVGNYSWTEISSAVCGDTDLEGPVIIMPDKLTAISGMDVQLDAGECTDNVRIKSYKWEMGNGDVVYGVRPRYSYQNTGKYKARLIVSDTSGNISEKEFEIQVKEKSNSGICSLTVVDYDGNPIPYAYVYVNSGSDSNKSYMTDAEGKVSLCYKAGSYKVAAFKDGFLPEEEEYTITNMKTTEEIIRLSSGEVVVGDFEVHRMSIQEIVDAGVDLSSPANLNTYTFKTTLTFQKTPIPVVVDVIEGDVFQSQGDAPSGGFDTPNFEIPWSGGNEKRAGGKARLINVSGDIADAQPVPVIAVITTTQSVSWLKSMYNASLTITNMADSKYILEDSTSTIELPDGVSLAVMDSSKNDSRYQSLTIDMGDIAGQTSETASWTLKGDKTGSYDINAVFSSVLQPFDVPITKRFAASTEMEVDNTDIEIKVMPESAYYLGEDYYVHFSITNNGAEDLYGFTTSIGDYRVPDAKDVVYIMDPDTEVITSTQETGGGLKYILSMDEQLYQMPVLSGSDSVTVPTLKSGATIYGTWKYGEGDYTSHGLAGDFQKEYFKLIDSLVEVIEGENLGVTVEVYPISSHVSKTIRTYYKEEDIVINTGDPVDMTSGAFTEDINLLSLSGVNLLEYGLRYNSVTAGDGTIIEEGNSLGRGWTGDYDSFIVEESGLIKYYTNPYMYSAFITEDAYRGSLLGTADGEDKITLSNSDTAGDIRFVSINHGMEGYVLTRHPDGTYEMESPTGQILRYKSDGQISGIVMPDKTVISITYTEHQKKVEEKESGNKIIITYNDQGKVISVGDGGSRVTRLSYSGDDLTVITDPIGRSTYFEYDDAHHIIAEKNNAGEIFIQNEYSENKLITRQTDAAGKVIDFTYSETEGGCLAIADTKTPSGDLINTKKVLSDELGRVTKVENESGSVEIYSYDTEGNLVSKQDGYGNAYSYTYDSEGRLTSSRGIAGQNFSTTYDERGNVTSIVTDDDSATYTYDTAGRLISSRVLGEETSYSYNSIGQLTGERRDGKGEKTYEYRYGRLASSTDELGKTTGYEFDSAGNLTSIKGPGGEVWTYSYNAVNQKISETDANGNTTYYTYNDYNELASVRDALGNVTSYGYDTAGRMTSMTMPDGAVITYEYDLMGNKTKEIYPDGVVYIYEYDAAGNNTKIIYPDETVEEFEYDVNGNLISSTDKKGNISTYTIDNAAEKMAGAQDSYGNTIRYTYDSEGRVGALDVSTGISDKYAYDVRGSVTSTEDILGNKTEYTYNVWGELERVTDSDGNVTEFIYDVAGNCIEKLLPTGLDIHYSYDDSYNIVEVSTRVSGQDIVERYTYDCMDNILTYTDAMGRVTKYTYDALGRVISEETPDSIKVTLTYDSVGNIVREESSDGTSLDAVYDSVGRIVSVTNNGFDIDTSRIYNYEYDKMDRLVSVVDPESGETTKEYDVLGNVTSIGDAMGGTTTYTYDKTSRLMLETNAVGVTKKYSYDDRGRLITKENGRKQKTKITYDDYNRIIKVEDTAGTVEYTYDHNSNILTVSDDSGTITREYDSHGRVTAVTDSNGRTVRYSYDEIGNLISLTYPGGEIVRYSYYPDGQLKSVTDGASNNTSYEYDQAGRLNRTVMPDGSVSEQSYDKSGNLKSKKDTSASGEVLLSLEYTYDGFHNIKSIKDNIASPETKEYVSEYIPQDAVMEYDAANRLISYNGETVKYDADGNMTYGPLDGEMTTFEYDCRNRLIRAGDTYYSYDAENIRTETKSTNYTENYVTDRVSSPYRVLQITEERVGGKAETNNYYYGIGLIYEKIDTDTLVYHFDHLGSTRKITGKDGHIRCVFSYDTYGEIKSSWLEGKEDIRFLYNGALGVITDTNGLYYMRQRYYNPTIKRFINQDILIGHVTDSQSLNRYAYVQGNPVNYTDPFGLNPVKIIKSYSGVVHDILSVASIIPGPVGAVTGVINAGLYGLEGDYESAAKCMVQACLTGLVGPLAGAAVNGLSKLSTTAKVITSVAAIGAGMYAVGTSAYDLYDNSMKLSDEMTSDGGGSLLNKIHYISNIINSAAGIAYGVIGIAGGIGIFDSAYKDVTKSNSIALSDQEYPTLNNEVDVDTISANIVENEGGSGSDIDRIKKVAQQSYDYAVNNPRQSGLNRMQLGKDAEVQATRWTRKWAERNGIDLSEEGLHFQVRGNHSIPDVVYEPTHSIMDFKLTPKAIRKIQSDNFKLDFPDYSIEYIFGPGPWRDN